MTKTVVCSASPTTNPHCVEDRADIVFFAGLPDDLIEPETKSYFANCKKWFTDNYPKVIQNDAIDLHDMIEALNKEKRGNLPWGRIYICCHANEQRWFMRAGGPYQAGYFKDLIKLREAQNDGQFPRINDPMRDFLESKDPDKFKKDDDISGKIVIDPFTQIVIKCCNLGQNRRMLDVISDVFNEWPDVMAPRFSLFLRPDPKDSSKAVERFFRDIGTAVIPGKGRTPPLTAAEQAMVIEQLHKLYPNATDEHVKDLVSKDGNVAWKSGANQEAWAMASEAIISDPQTIILNEDDSGKLYLEDANQNQTFLDSVNDGKAVDRPKLQKAFGEAFGKLHGKRAFANIKYWKPTNWKYEDIAKTPNNPKAHRVSASLLGTEIDYHQIVKDTAGKPIEPNVDKPGHYVVSTWSMRCSDYYNSQDWKAPPPGSSP